MPQNKPIALTLMSASLLDLLVGLYFLIFADNVIVGVICILSAGVIFFLGIACMPGGTPGESEGFRQDDWGPMHSDWDSTD